MDNILVSIIVPAYNIESYIGRCLESILSQSHKNIEIIVVDDGSKDGTWKVIEQYASTDHRIVPVHKENGGVSSARLVGIQQSKGEYIGFVDGDDYIEPEMYEHLLGNALKYGADISHCGYKMIYPDGHIVEYYGTRKVKEHTKDEALIALLNGDYIEPGLWNKLYHRSAILDFERENIWDSTIGINEDLLMNYLIFKNCEKCVYEDVTPYHYMLRSGSAATSKTSYCKITDPIKVMQLIQSDIEDNTRLSSIVYQRYLRLLIYNSMQTVWKKEQIEAKNSLKEELVSTRFKERTISIKLKLMVIGTVYFPDIYKFIRKCYEGVTGISKKYEI